MVLGRPKVRIIFTIKTVKQILFSVFIIYILENVGQKGDCKENFIVGINKCCNFGEVLDGLNCVTDYSDRKSKGPLHISKWRVPSSAVQIKDYRQNSLSNRAAATIKTRVKVHRPPQCETRFQLNEEELPVKVNFEGQLKLKDENGHLMLIKKENFCIDTTINQTLTVEVCKPECDADSFCFRKCCLPHEVIDVETFGCVPVDDVVQRWIPFLYESSSIPRELNFNASENEIDNNLIQEPIRVGDSYIEKGVLIIGPPTCPNGTQYDISFKEKRFYLLTSGELAVDGGDDHYHFFPPTEFCVDSTIPQEDLIYRIARSFINSNKDTNSNLSFINSVKSYIESHQYAFVCFPDGEEEADYGVLESSSLSDQLSRNWRFAVLPIFKLISSFFLLVTAVIYLILWKDHSLPGWLQFSYTISLFIAFSFLSVVQLWTQEVYHFSIHLCRALGYTILASFLSVFFWLTCMNIDLYLIFRACPMKTNLGKRKAKRKFLGFALICMGIPAAIVATAIHIDLAHRENPGKETMIPRTKIGEDACTLNLYDKMAQLYYFYFPVGTLLVINLIFFFCTAACLRERQKETKVANCNSTAGDYDRERFQLFTRLFFVMGVLWIFELISWVAETVQLDEKICRIFIVTDILNSLQGVAVFVMFVWKPHTLRQLKQKFLRAFWKQGIFKRNSTQKSNTSTNRK